jgi:hypothetical protein
MRICDALSKGENPLSSEEIHSMQTCYQILKINSDDKIAFNATAADEGRGDPALTIAEIQKLLGGSGRAMASKEIQHPFIRPPALEAHICSLDNLKEGVAGCNRQ